MKHATVTLEENKIELFNTLLGKETVKVNGNIVSEKSSITGTDHNFVIIENGTEVKCKLNTGFGINGVVFNLYKNDKPVIESPKNSFLIFLFFIFIGIAAYGLLSNLL